MGRERRVDGSSGTAPPNRFEVDLTSVCVRRGALQLPYRLQGAFEEGVVAAVDADGGASLDLRFRPPRELAGLRAYFDAHGLRANDRIALVFVDGGLRIEAVRREHKAPGRRAAGETAPASAAALGERRRSRDARAGAAPAAPPDRGAGDPTRSAAPLAPPSLRVAAPPPSEPAQERSQQGSEKPQEPVAPAGAPHWEPLDVTASRQDDRGERATPEGAASAGQREVGSASTPVVREIRRGAPLLSPGKRSPEQESDDTRAAPRQGAAGGVENAAAPQRRQDEHAGGGAAGWSRDLFGIRRRLGLGRRGTDAAPASPTGPAGQARGGQQVDATQPPADRHDGAAARWPARSPEVAVDEEQEAAGRVATEAAIPNDVDRQAVLVYLRRPDVPAIVRAERVAEELGLAPERVDAALDRISEGSERLSRIRAGAYMLRRGDED